MGWGGVGTAGETSASGRASCLGIPSLLGSSFQFPFTQEQQEMPARVLPKGRCSQRGGGGRPPRDFLRFELPRSPAPPQGVLPGIPQTPLHGAESRPHPLTEALGEFQHLRGILHRPERHPSGELPTGFRPSRRRPRPPLRLGPLLCPRPPASLLHSPSHFLGRIPLSQLPVSRSPYSVSHLASFAEQLRYKERQSLCFPAIPFVGWGRWRMGEGAPASWEAWTGALKELHVPAVLGLRSLWRRAVHLPRDSHFTAPLPPTCFSSPLLTTSFTPGLVQTLVQGEEGSSR